MLNRRDDTTETLTVRTPWSHPHLPPTTPRILAPDTDGGAVVRTPWSHANPAVWLVADESHEDPTATTERPLAPLSRRWFRPAAASA